MRALAPPAGRDVGRRTVARPADPAATLGYQPALDGLRAVSLVGVLLFHHGYRSASGGFLGVSTFFTLSGFLITTLAVTEWAGTGRLSPARFYERRARRLLPAALLTFAGVVALRALTPVGSGEAFRGDVLAALGYAANWRFAATGDDYAALFAQPSPVLHFWSLAIEEQFYLAFPLLFVAVMALATRLTGRRHPTPSPTDPPGDAPEHGAADRSRTDLDQPDDPTFDDEDDDDDRRAGGVGDGVLVAGGVVFGVLAAVSFVLAWVLASRDGNDGGTYYGTHTRAGELLAGVTLAFLVRTAWSRRWLATRAVAGALAVAGPLALVGLVGLWHGASLDGPRLFHGVTAVNAGLSGLLILAAFHAAAPFRAGLGVVPLRALGKVSYAAYLFHWPIFLWLDAPRVELGHHALFALRVGVTLVLATASYHLLEAPFRFRLRMPRPRLAAGLAGGAAVVAALVVVVPQHTTDRIDFSAVGNPTAPPAGTDPAAPPPSDPGAGDPEGNPDVEPQFPFLRQEGLIRPAGDAPPALRILLVGDSLASSLIAGLEGWNDDHPDEQIWVDTHTVFGCPLVDTGVTPILGMWPTTAQCVDWHQDLDNALVRYDTDAVLFTMGLADLQGHEVGGRMLDIGDPAHDEWFATELDRLAGTLTAPGRPPLLWANFPHVRMESPAEPTKDWTDYPLNEPRRVDRLNELLAGVADRHPGITPVDLDGWVHGWSGGEFDAALRDGVHFLDEGADLAAGWLVPQLMAAATTGTTGTTATSAPPTGP